MKLSHSSISLYSECPLKWRLRYVDRVPEKPRHYFSFGNAIHAALEHMYSGEACCTLADLFGAFRAAWSDAGYKDEKAILKARKEGEAMLADFHMSEAGGWAKPLKTEVKFDMAVDHVRVTGYIDRVDVGLHVIDYKTGREVDVERVKDDEQLTLYQMAAEEMFPGERVDRLSLLHVPSLTWHTAPRRSDMQVEAMRAKVVDVAGKISREEFGAKPSEKACAWCDHKASCEAWK